MTYAPTGSGVVEIASEGKDHQNFTLGLCTTGAGKKLILMIIFTGKMQPLETQPQDVVVVDAHGVKKTVKAFVAFTSSHYNNEFCYAEYIQSCIAPNFPQHDCCDDQGCKSIFFLHDDASLHWTQRVTEELEKIRGVANLKVPDTRHVQPNDYNINKNVEKSIKQKPSRGTF